MSLEVETIETVAGLEALEPEWQDLWRRDPSATPFQHPSWLLPWTRRLWGGGKLRVLAIRENGRLTALAPLFLWGYGGRPEIVRVSFLGAGVTDHLGMIADPTVDTRAARLVFEQLAASDGWHVCDFEELRPGSPLLRTEMPPGMIARSSPSSACPVLALPSSMDELLARLSPKFRKNLRQADARLHREGARFFTAETNDLDAIMRALFRLHAARWTERREPGVLASEPLQRFHLEAARGLLAHGLLRLNAIELRGEIIAVQHNLRRDGRLYYYLSGFDPAQARFSPGAALLAWTIRSAISDGAVELDFLRHREEYKYQWGARDRVNRKLLLSHSAYARDVA